MKILLKFLIFFVYISKIQLFYGKKLRNINIKNSKCNNLEDTDYSNSSIDKN